MPHEYFVTETFQPLNSTTDWNTKFLCLSYPQLHKPPRSCRIERAWQPRSRVLLPRLAAAAGWSTASQAIPRASWGWLCPDLWGNQNMRFLIQEELGSCASDKTRIFPLCKEPASSCSPGRAPEQHVCWALNSFPLHFLWVLHMQNTASQAGYFQKCFEVFSPLNNHMPLQLKWVVGACLQQMKPELVRRTGFAWCVYMGICIHQ